ncbi:uncharacterized protein LOC113208881 [Frankliniella occidentalis]|uniref:Uncharacterized protein LOC113208881 n=1 Tax=Frankliniella occidentalis TaxID=133901 RepID=A0A6J1SMC6_FRAOC|nr:uncharacterized protein LOC113208881 [Frankliniella occidentalis]
MKAATVAGVLLALLCGAACSPILGVPAYSVMTAEDDDSAGADGADTDFSHLVVTTGSPRHQAAPQRAPAASTAAAGTPDDVVPLATDKDRGRFLATLLMLESLHDKPYPVHGVADAKLKKEILADEDLMQEVLKLYETTQETKGQHFIKIPPRLMKKMKQKMAELLSE